MQWIKSLGERPREKPFFMWFAAIDVHRVWGPNEFSNTHDPDKISPPPYLADRKETRSDLAKYYDEIKRFDHSIGEVEKVMKGQGVWDNTVIIIMADNGRPFPRCKTKVYDSGMKTPFIIRWSEQLEESQVVCHSMINVCDIAPTILELAGIAVSESLQGHRFQNLLANSTEYFRTYIFAEDNWHDYEAHERMLRTEDFMYVLNSRPQLPNQGPLDAVNSDSLNELSNLREQGLLNAAQADVFMTPRPREELYDCNRDSI